MKQAPVYSDDLHLVFIYFELYIREKYFVVFYKYTRSIQIGAQFLNPPLSGVANHVMQVNKLGRKNQTISGLVMLG